MAPLSVSKPQELASFFIRLAAAVSMAATNITWKQVLTELFHPAGSSTTMSTTSTSSSSRTTVLHTVKDASDAAVLRCLQERGPQVVAALQARLAEAEATERDQAAARDAAVQKAMARKVALEGLLAKMQAQEAADAVSATSTTDDPQEEARRARAHELVKVEHEHRYLTQLYDAMALVESRGDVMEVLEQLVERRSPQEFPELDRYVCEAGRDLIAKQRDEALVALRKGLDGCGWPPAMGRAKEDGGTDEVAAFSTEVLAGLQRLIRLQAVTQRFQFGSHVEFAAGASAGGNVLWVSEELSLPLLERFAFHFEENAAAEAAAAKKGHNAAHKNISDRPDWMFAFLLRALRLSKPALVDPGLDRCLADYLPQLSSAVPHPLLGFFARDLALAARRKIRALLVDAEGGGVWTDDEALTALAEGALQFDKTLDEEANYHHCGAGAAAAGPLLQGVKWPRAADVLTAPPERLERWADVETEWVTASLEESCAAEGAWDASPGFADQVAPPTPAAQAFAGLVALLTERYQPLRNVPALRVLVDRTLKHLVRAYLNQLYEAAKACRLSRAPFHPGFDGVLRRYCLLVTATHLGLEAVEDAAADVTILRLEGSGSGGEGAGPASKAGAASALVLEAASSLLVAGQETVGSALRTATATTETLTRAVEESGTIIGPMRLLTKALGPIQRVVGTPTTASPSSRRLPSGLGDAPASPSSLLEKLTTSMSPPRVNTSAASASSPRNAAPQTPTKTGGAGIEKEHSALEGAALRLEDDGVSTQTASVLGQELLHLRSFEDGMLEDALGAVTAGFHDHASEYLGYLPPALVPTQEPSSTILPSLTFLDTVLQVAGQALEKDALLKLWQGVVYMVAQAFLRRVRATRVVSEAGAKQMVVDVEALVKVLSRPAPPGSVGGGGALRPDNYLKPLRETVGVLAWPSKSLESLYAFLVNLLEDADADGSSDRPGGGLPEEGSAAAAQVQYALEAKGLHTLSADEVLALIEQRRRGDEAAANSRKSPSFR